MLTVSGDQRAEWELSYTTSTIVPVSTLYAYADSLHTH